MSNRKIGLYIGLNSVGAVVVEGKNITSVAKFDLASLEEEARVENLNEDIRWEALINKALREVGAEEKNIYVSLADKDFIFRSLEMPSMSKKNISSSLMYEIEKYIPFKIDELIWAFDYTNYPREKKMNVSFLGIRESTLYRTQEMLSHLGLNPIMIEPSALSLAKILKTNKKYAKYKHFAILDMTENESYLTLFSLDLPVFNQYIVVPKKGGGIDLDKFLESVRFAFQYFKREFRSYELEKFLILSNYKEDALITSLKEELQTEVELTSPYELTLKPNIEVESLKAYGVATADVSSYKFKPVLKKTEELVEKKIISDTGIRLGPLFTLVGIGLLVALGVSIVMGNEITTLDYKFKRENETLHRPPAIKQLSWSEIADLTKGIDKRVNTLKELRKHPKAAAFLSKISGLRPKGLWFDQAELVYQKGKYIFILNGNIFLGDPYSERTSIDKFISSLKSEEAITKCFSSVEMTFSDKKKQGDFTLTFFTIKFE